MALTSKEDSNVYAFASIIANENPQVGVDFFMNYLESKDSLKYVSKLTQFKNGNSWKCTSLENALTYYCGIEYLLEKMESRIDIFLLSVKKASGFTIDYTATDIRRYEADVIEGVKALDHAIRLSNPENVYHELLKIVGENMDNQPFFKNMVVLASHYQSHRSLILSSVFSLMDIVSSPSFMFR